jgi:hypothetical protein
MASCPSVVFQNVDDNAWACLKTKAAAYATAKNVTLPALNPSGSASHMGFSATWAWDQNAKTLTITCTDHPFIIGCGTILAQIHSGIAGTGCIPGAT